MLEQIITVINFLNKEKVKYNLIDEDDQVRVELFLNNDHQTEGDYIVITEDGRLCMNLFSDLPFKNVEDYIKTYNQ